MFNRRMFVALAVCLVVSASSAFAGGGGGAKKDSTIRFDNRTFPGALVYVFVDVKSADILAASAKPPAEILAAFNALGGKPIAVGASASFSLKSGAHLLTVVNVDVPGQVFVDRPVTTVKGQTAVVQAF